MSKSVKQEKKIEEVKASPLKSKSQIKSQGGSCRIPVGVDFIRDLGWEPGTDITITLVRQEMVGHEAFQGLLIEKLKKV